MYEPKEYEGKLPDIAVCGPFGAVKEQSSGLYAQEMAERGFLTIAFDPSFTGESSGEPRYMNSPDINIELKERLKNEDIVVNAHEYGGFEKVGNLGFSLPNFLLQHME